MARQPTGHQLVGSNPPKSKRFLLYNWQVSVSPVSSHFFVKTSKPSKEPFRHRFHFLPQPRVAAAAAASFFPLQLQKSWEQNFKLQKRRISWKKEEGGEEKGSASDQNFRASRKFSEAVKIVLRIFYGFGSGFTRPRRDRKVVKTQQIKRKAVVST